MMKVKPSPPQAGSKSIVEAEAAEGADANGHQGANIAQKGAAEGQQDQ